MLRALFHRPTLLAVLLLSLPLRAAEVKLEVRPDRETGIYAAGETVTWTVSVTSDGQPATGELKWWVKSGGLLDVASGTAPVAEGRATVSATRADAGTLLLTTRWEPAGGERVQAYGGAIFDVERIGPSAPPPDDFDQFWADKLAELAAVAPNAVIEPAESDRPEVEYFKITLDNIRGTRIYGQLARPKGKTDLPAMLQVQYAGVYPLQRAWVTGPAAQGWLTLNIIAHDLPIDRPAEFYQQLNETTLKGYPALGREDREQSYFLRMFLSCYRAADFLTQQPEWNGRTLIVQGGSQGGGQAVVTAGLHPRVTALAANVPALCDHTGQLVGRAPGWPRLTGWGNTPDSEPALAASRYFDAVNFARRVKATSALVGVGLVDTTCPPAGVAAMYNTLPCAKQLVIMPRSGHGGQPGHNDYYRAYGAWLERQRTGG